MLDVRRPRVSVTAAAAALVLAAILAACSGGPAASSAPATPLPSGVIAVAAQNLTFNPSAITVPAGPVRFSIKNTDSQEHEFEIFKGDQVVAEVEGLLPGLTKDLPVDLAAGEYTFVCKLNGHDQLGMKGTLTVTGS